MASSTPASPASTSPAPASAILASYWRKGGTLERGPQGWTMPAREDEALAPAERRALDEHREEIDAILAAQPDYFDWRPLQANPRALWFLHRLAPHSAAYHCTAVLGMDGRIEDAQLAAAFERLCARHPMLRAQFGERDGEPCYRILAEHRNECRALAADADLAQAKRTLLAEADRPFALEQAAVMRLSSVRVGQRVVVSLVLHHIVADFYSCEILARELVAELSGGTADAAAASYEQWSRENAEYLDSDRGRDAAQYWQALLRDAPAELQLPTDFVRPSLRQWSGERIERDLDPGLSAQVRATATALGVTPYIVLLAAYQLWLWRLGGQADFVIGTPTLGRHAARHRHLVGYLANPVPVRARIDPQQRFADLAAALKMQMDSSLRRQRYPLTRLLDELALPRRSDRAPLFQHFFTYSQARLGWGEAVAMETLHMGMRGAAHELILTVFENGADLCCQIGYCDALYGAQTVSGWLDGYVELLARIVADPSRRLDALDWAGHGQAGERGETIDAGARHSIERIESAPDAHIALHEGERTLDYAALRASARTLAAGLQAHGGEVVALALPRGETQIVGMLAAWYAGQAWLALDPRLPDERLAYMVEDSGARVVLGDGPRPAWLPTAAAWYAPDALTGESLDETARNPNDVAYLIYTSGSTGQPKGVAVSHANLCGYVEGVLARLQQDRPLAQDAVFSTLATASADLGHTALFGALLSGRGLRLIDDALARDPHALAEHLQRHRVDVLKIVPSHLQALLAAEQPQRLLPRQALVFGGEALPWPLVDQIRALAPHCRVFNHYGPTETTVGATCIDTERAPRGTASVAIGMPLPNYRAYVLDQQGRAVAQGAIGELYIGGIGVARGYWRREALSAERFLPDPLDPSQRVYRTGDRVQRLPAGELVFHGRADDQVKIRGYRVEPGEVEQRLRAVPGVEQAVVLAAPGANGTQTLAAFYRGAHADPLATLRAALPDYMVPARCLRVDTVPVTANGKVDRAALLALLDAAEPAAAAQDAPLEPFEARLAALWQPLFPQATIGPQSSFFGLGGDSILALRLVASARKSGIELTPALLLETASLRELAQRLRPPSPTELLLRQACAQALGRDRIDRDADFFELGGDSIAALKLVARARQAGLALTPAELLEHRPLSALAAHLDRAADAIDAVAPAPVEPTPAAALAPFGLLDAAEGARLRAAHADAIDAYPLSPLQEGLLFAALAAPDSGQYLNQQVLSLTGPLDRARLVAAWSALQQRHESLRVGFDWDHAGRPVQWLPVQAGPSMHEHDWSGRDSARTQAELWALCERERDSAFALERPGLLRLHLVCAGPSQAWLVLTVHHLVIDRWSAAVLLQELFALYAGEALPPAPRYRDYIGWLGAQPVQGEDAFWRAQLADYEGGEELPAPAAPGEGRYVTEARLARAEIVALRECAARLQVPLTSVLQAAWALLLSRYTNSADVCFGLTVSGRPPALAQAERMTGLFINTLPMRLRLEAGQDFGALCRKARDLSFAVQAHDRLPLARIAELAGVPNGAALLHSLLVIENIPLDTAARLPDGLAYEFVHAASATNLPLLVQITPEDDSLHLLLQSQRNQLPDDFVERVLGDWLRLLRGVAGLVDTPVGQMGLLAPADWAAWRARGQGPALPFVPERMPDSLADCIERAAARHPGEPALVGGGRCLSYDELNRRANRLAHHLRALGLSAGERVALVADRSVAITVAMLAVLKAGGAYVPIDPEHPHERIAFVLADAGCRFALARDAGLACVSGGASRVLDLDSEALLGELAAQPERNPARNHDAASPAYVIYTSGSTGQPKGVLVPHRGPLRLMQAVQAMLPAGPGDRVLQFTGLHFDMSVLEWLCAWTQGACLHLIERELTRSGDGLLALLAEQAITHVVAQPAVFAPLPPPSLPALRYLLLGGDVCPTELAERWGRGRVVLNGYGPTEASVLVTADRYEPGRAIALGHPLPHAQCYVLDWSGQPCPPESVGELHLAGDYLAHGYLGLPEKTAAAFRTPERGPLAGVRLYATGDRVRQRRDGRLEFLGRRDHQVKIRGLRIELGEVEAALRAQAGVAEAVALVHRPGQDNACLVAFVQGEADPAALREALRLRLPAHLLPAHIECRATLPQSASRKVDRRALAALVEHVLRPQVRLAPASDSERRLLAVWQRLFQRDAIGVTEDFFALGGHSLLATRLASAIALEFDLRLDLRRLFATTTIRDQALLIDALQAAALASSAGDGAESVIESGFL
ncbi:amino acid adenylation domain-containing protein [Lysobacter yananisis]|uniref:Amino acid adenylation domain-containing protein n=1 Tax=Lysobacter yananisis TaxID=1003114 RepID=A0ABY9P541_9GAMM|nr:non-ribosomal peptide synthetase [Lysobacter yananisis]WMT02147.1 amino acid adenylation domain-containing protein [Lysobacter yananisis]